MLKEIIASILIPTFLMQVFGCYSNYPINKENLINYVDNKIKIVTSDRKEYSGEAHLWLTNNDTLFIMKNDSSKNKIIQKVPISSIRLLYTVKFDIPETILAGLGVSFIVIAIIELKNAMNHLPFGR